MSPSVRPLRPDFLGEPFVSVPFEWLAKFSSIGLTAIEFVFLLQILASSQVLGKELAALQELGEVCGISPNEAGALLEGLVERGVLRIGERIDAAGTPGNYFDLAPLWDLIRSGKQRDAASAEQQHVDEDAPGAVVTLFEQEFGRPLTGFECEQIRNWLAQDNYPAWMIGQALRESVLANKYSFKYIDRILYDWQRNRIRTRQELEAYRQQYRERVQARDQVAATHRNRKATPAISEGERDARYSAFYQLFPDA